VDRGDPYRGIGGYGQPQNLAELLTLLDVFLRCRELPIAELLAKFLESRGSVHPPSMPTT
jgi:hypothetical protein